MKGTRSADDPRLARLLARTDREQDQLTRAFSRPHLARVAAALAPFLFGGNDHERAQLAARRVTRGVHTAYARHIRALERDYRSHRFHQAHGGTSSVFNADLDRWLDGGPEALGPLAIASVQRAGVVRERAIRALGRRPEAPVLALLLVRLNDPVAQVRGAARAALEKRLVPANAAVFARYLPLVEGMATWVRTAGDALAERIQALLEREPLTLREYSRHRDADVRMGCYRLLARRHRGHEQMALVLRAAFADGDPRVRHLAATLALDLQYTPKSLRPALLDDMWRDRSPRIRRTALRELCRLGQAERYVRASVFDVNADVRFVARQQALRLELGIQYRATALAALAAPDSDKRQLVAALATLSDNGMQADCATVDRFRHHAIAAVRREADRTARILECDLQETL